MGARQNTVEGFDRCRKNDLLLIADFFSVSVPRSKQEMNTMLFDELVAQRILPKPDDDDFTGVAGVETPQTKASPNPSVSRSSIEDSMIAMRLKELDLQLSRQEYQNQLLKLQAYELENDHEIKLKELELHANDWKPIPIPRKSLVGIPVLGQLGAINNYVPPYTGRQICRGSTIAVISKSLLKLLLSEISNHKCSI